MKNIVQWSKNVFVFPQLYFVRATCTMIELLEEIY